MSGLFNIHQKNEGNENYLGIGIPDDSKKIKLTTTVKFNLGKTDIASPVKADRINPAINTKMCPQ